MYREILVKVKSIYWRILLEMEETYSGELLRFGRIRHRGLCSSYLRNILKLGNIGYTVFYMTEVQAVASAFIVKLRIRSMDNYIQKSAKAKEVIVTYFYELFNMLYNACQNILFLI